MLLMKNFKRFVSRKDWKNCLRSVLSFLNTFLNIASSNLFLIGEDFYLYNISRNLEFEILRNLSRVPLQIKIHILARLWALFTKVLTPRLTCELCNPLDDWFESTSLINHPAGYIISGLIREFVNFHFNFCF